MFHEHTHLKDKKKRKLEDVGRENLAGITTGVKCRHPDSNSFMHSNFNVSETISINGENVERVYQFKYLGVWLDSTLSFTKHREDLNGRLSSALGRMHNFKRSVSDRIFKMLLNAYVDSIVNFCISRWAVQANETLNLLYYKILRFLININHSSLAKKCIKLRLRNRDRTRGPAEASRENEDGSLPSNCYC